MKTRKGYFKMIKLSDSEIAIMQIIWKYGEATSFDILDEIEKTNELSPNTIRTLLGRMVRKKAITIIDKKGKVYIYKALIDKEEFQKVETESFLKNIYDGSIKKMLLNIIEDNNLSKKDVEELIKMIDKGDN